MARKSSGLGRGIDSIFLENSLKDAPVAQGGRASIRLSQIDPKNDQPRKSFDEDALASLAESIKLYGVLQPILVREMGFGRYQIVAGERRWRAAKKAKLSEIPAIVISGDDKEAAEIALIENVQREDLNPLEEAMGYRTLLRDYKMTQEELAAAIGKSRSAIANMLRLLDLPDSLLALLATGEISPGHARAILSLVRDSDREVLAAAIVENDLSVRAAEEAARRMNRLAEREEEEEKNEEKRIRVDYAAHLEKRLMQNLGRKVQIRDTKKKKTLTLYFEDNEDLEGLLTLLCGKEFLSEL